MTPRGRRVLVALAVLVLVGMAGAIGTWWLFNTQDGAEWGVERLGGFFPGRLDVEHTRGLLRGPLMLLHFTYRNDRLAITADSVYIDWRLRELALRRLDFHSLHARNVRIVVGGPGDTPEARDSLAGPLPDLNLPVTVIVRDGLLDGLTLARPGSDSGLVIDRVRLDARSARRDSLRVNALLVRSRTIDLDFSGTALPRGAYPLLLRGHWTYRPPGRPVIYGEGTLAGTLEALRLRQRLTGPFTADVDMTLNRPLRRQVRYAGNVAFSRVTPREFLPSAPQGTFRGTVALEGDLRAVVAQGQASGTTEALGPTSARFRIRRDERAVWRIDDAVVTRPGEPGRLTARGTVAGDASNARFDLTAEWAAMGWPVRGKRWVESERGSARVRGTTRDFDVSLKALLAGRNLPPGHWSLEGRGGNGRLAVRTVIADLLGGRIVGSGSVAWTPVPSWRLAFDGRGINPGTVWPAYPGNLSFAGRSEGRNDRGGPSGRILVSRLDGTLRNIPVTASGTLTASRGQYTLAGATATLGPNRLNANGRFGRVNDLAWKIDAPQVGAVVAQGSGSLRGEGTLRGTRAHPHLAGTLAGDSLFVGEAHAATLRMDGDLDLRPGGVLRLDLAAERVSVGTHGADRLLVSARGTRERHEWRGSVSGPADSTVLALDGGFGANGWRGAVTRLDLVNPRSGNWSLAGPARVTYQEGRAVLADFDWRSGTSRITASGDWARRGPWHLDSRLERVDLALLQPGLPARLRLEGAMAGHVTARGSEGGQLFADVDIVPGPGQILHQTSGGQWTPTRFENARIRVTADGRRVEANAAADLVNVGTVRGNLGWPAFGSFAEGTSRPLDGRVALHLRDLSLAQGLTPEIESTSGSLDADLTVAGTVQHPFLYGPLTLRSGSANLPRYGLELREMNIEGRGSPGGAIALHGSVRSGTGTITIDGTASVARGARPIADVRVRGQRVQAINTRDMRVVASPDLRFALNGARLDITGEVIVPEGNIDIGSADKRRLVKVSPDVVFTGADTLTGRPSEVYTRVRLVLGNRVRVTGFGLDVRPTGSLIASDSPGLPTLGSGRLDIKDGRYQIYGQDLNVETGSLIFAGGPITNPAVRARATRTAADGTVAGFLVSGTVMKPEVQVFSEPALQQSEALSYIMFGKPIESANLSEGQIASTMATTMGVPGTNLLAQGLASELGIEQARIDVGSSIENTSLSLGTHLSPKLFVSAGMDVFQSTSTLRLRYILNRIFTIEAETARQNRVDILYTIEP